MQILFFRIVSSINRTGFLNMATSCLGCQDVSMLWEVTVGWVTIWPWLIGKEKRPASLAFSCLGIIVILNWMLLRIQHRKGMTSVFRRAPVPQKCTTKSKALRADKERWPVPAVALLFVFFLFAAPHHPFVCFFCFFGFVITAFKCHHPRLDDQQLNGQCLVQLSVSSSNWTFLWGKGRPMWGYVRHGSMMVQVGVPFIWMVSVEAHESLKWPKSAKSAKSGGLEFFFSRCQLTRFCFLSSGV